MHICNSKSTTELYGWKIHPPSPWFLLIPQFSRLPYLWDPASDWRPLSFPQPASQLPSFVHFLACSPLLSRVSYLLILSPTLFLPCGNACASVFGDQSRKSHLSLMWGSLKDATVTLTLINPLSAHSTGAFARHWSGRPLQKAAYVAMRSQSPSLPKGRTKDAECRDLGMKWQPLSLFKIRTGHPSCLLSQLINKCCWNSGSPLNTLGLWPFIMPGVNGS